MQDTNELIKILVEALSPLLGTAAKTIATNIAEKVKHSNSHHGYTKIAPLHPTNNTSPHATIKFKETHKLGNKRSTNINEEANLANNDYQTQANTHREERNAGKIQRRIKELVEHNHDNAKHVAFFRR